MKLGQKNIEAAETLKKLCPTLDLSAIRATYEALEAQKDTVNQRWQALRNFQNFDFDNRLQFLSVPDIAWKGYLNQEIISHPVSKRARKRPERRKLVCKVYSRPGLVCGLRAVACKTNTGEYLDNGVAYLAGGCQPPDSPISSVIITNDILWATSVHGFHWSRFQKPAPVVVPIGPNNILRHCFGDKVRGMVAWSSNWFRAVRIGMEYDCRVSLLKANQGECSTVPYLNSIVDDSEHWTTATSRVIVQTPNPLSLIDLLPRISAEHRSALSRQAQRVLNKISPVKV